MEKQERKRLCELIDSKKLSTEASLHAAQNSRLPVRAIIQVMFTEQTKLSHRRKNNIDWSGSSFSPNPSSSHYSESGSARCTSKREINVQQTEIRRLREDMAKLQSDFEAMQTQLEKVIEKKGSYSNNSGSKGFFRWKKLGFRSGFSVSVLDKTNGEEFGDHGEEYEYVNQTPSNVKTKIVKGRTPSRWRKSMS